MLAAHVMASHERMYVRTAARSAQLISLSSLTFHFLFRRQPPRFSLVAILSPFSPFWSFFPQIRFCAHICSFQPHVFYQSTKRYDFLSDADANGRKWNKNFFKIRNLNRKKAQNESDVSRDANRIGAFVTSFVLDWLPFPVLYLFHQLWRRCSGLSNPD